MAGIDRRPFISPRIAQWSVVAALILTLILVFLQRVQFVQRQAEWAAVRSTLGGLRTAFVLQHRHRVAVQNQTGVVVQRNPFELLERRPANYFGEIRPGEWASVRPGYWVFDAVCVCVGYLPVDVTGFDSPSGDTVAWYRVEGAAGVPLQLTAKDLYLWQGQIIN